MTRRETIRFLILRSIGNFLLLFAIFGVFATFGPAFYYEIQYKVVQARGVHYTVQVASSKGQVTSQSSSQGINPQISTSSGSFGEVVTGPTEQILIPPDTLFSIVIPKIGAISKITPNVDSSDPNQFLPVLQHSVAHAKGTVFPGMAGTTYLFAHSTDNFWDVGRYNAVFYLLKDLNPGDDIVIFFENKRYDYKVTQTKIVDDSEVSDLVNSQKDKTQRLVLQTCWPPGTAWKRLLVIAEPK